MSFEDLDQQINDAADKHHPVYREEAWSRMQKLLDKHLPQERKRRRRALFLLPLLLLLSTGGFFMAGNFWEKDSNVLAQKRSEGTGDKGQRTGDEGLVTKDGSGERGISKQELGINNGQPITGNVQAATSNGQPVTSNPQSLPVRSGGQNPQFVSRNSSSAKKNNKETGASLMNDEEQTTDAAFITMTEQANEKTVDDDQANSHEQPATGNGQPGINDLQPEPGIHHLANDHTTAKRKSQTAKTSRFSRSFAITVNGGADLSAVRFSEPGQKRFIGGIGLQYQFLKNITVRTGFYQTHKVYGAKPKDYKGYIYTPSGYWLSGVSGDCRVFEIPVSIAYTINPGKKLNFFAAVGASSMIMKKEDYVYNYKSSYSPGYDYRHSVQNRNEHFLSSVDFSAGIQQNLNSRIFFRAEPYLRLPLRGVGVGNIKLKSAGVLLSAGIKPFAKK